MRELLAKLHFKFIEDSGSAVLEFISLGIPLFLPLSIFLTSINHDGTIQSQARNLARQAVRIYVSGPSQEISAERISYLKSIVQKEIFDEIEPGLEIEISITCDSSNCLTPNSRVRSDISIFDHGHHLLVRSNAFETVDQWKNT